MLMIGKYRGGVVPMVDNAARMSSNLQWVASTQSSNVIEPRIR